MISTTTRWFLTIIWLCSVATVYAQDFIEIAKLTPIARHNNQLFGGTVAISGDYAIVSARKEAYDVNEENPITDAGAAYIFEKEEGVWVFKQKLVQEHRWFSDQFGVMASIENEYAVVGIRREDLDDPNDPNSNRSSDVGAAIIYKRDVDGIWKEHQLIHGGDERKTGEQFGFPAKIKDGVILIGALKTDKWQDGEYLANIGSVYVFEKDEQTGQWVKVKKIIASDAVGQDQFGKMVDIHNGNLVVGANQHEPNGVGTWVGAAYVYSKDENGEWVERQKLEASNKKNGAQFGESVAISGDYIFVGAPGLETQEEFGNDSAFGAVYVFKKNNEEIWEEVQYIIRDDIWTFDEHFGQSISAFGDKVLISANEKYLSNTLGLGQGFCYLYEFNSNTGNWESKQTITAENQYSPKEFGLHVVMEGNTIIVGDKRDNGADQNVDFPTSGAAHIFEIPETLSISDIDKENVSLRIYPNPVGNTFYIQSENPLENSNILITDMLGRTVYHHPKITIDTSHKIEADFSKGTYILQLVSQGKTYTTKFTK